MLKDKIRGKTQLILQIHNSINEVGITLLKKKLKSNFKSIKH
jgi:hypothetical protein